MSLKPKTTGSTGGQPHKRPTEYNQQIAKSVRPQLPRDETITPKILRLLNLATLAKRVSTNGYTIYLLDDTAW